MNTLTVEKKVIKYLENILKPEILFDKRILQRKKFILLTKLVTKLFSNKNSKVYFKNISNLIILVLNMYNEKYPIDIFSKSEDDALKNDKLKYKHILKEEFLLK
ncbi:MAG: hypothetical protein ACFFCE_11330 [Promethearchaeota archaeon]